ncbi:alpha/beta fold hydrolase [Pediococcus cellicola]|uniref:alpha/beta fold hydrolase n=1 Tax=Pediococcus cellicola TaxID=319652 RepID=UPI00070E4CFF|nr:alpha/beta hydrolase [Pediococcus cellicola]GEL14804.1 alpha/beta hydrolase [Pediococcus cellicola]
MANHSIHFHDYIQLNGIQQWVTISSTSRANPILLVIHGGPGSTYSMFEDATQQFARQFTVVHWDQRGAGKTYRKQKVVPRNLQTLVEDGLTLTQKLKRVFPDVPIILWGSSIGSILANLMVQQGENLYDLYVATEQMTQDSHQFAYDQLLAETKHQSLRRHWLQKLPADAHHWTAKQINQFNIFSAIQRSDVPNMVTTLFIKNMLQNRDYSWQDCLAFIQGMRASYRALHKELDAFDYRRLLTKIGMPFVIFQGAHDPITPAQATQRYFDQVQAPVKKLFIVPGAGHLCLFARPKEVSELRRLVFANKYDDRGCRPRRNLA